ncbi:MAG: heat-inducible transcription repressor HrcA [Candidatus Marinimicrobia bacterium]|nr:heat-inducible transcription repressor HrcA [Candidatus Neomarinimicrobiota bacterium]
MFNRMKDCKNQTSNRDRIIFKIVVEDFVRTAHPVASKRLKDKYKIDLSSSSIRNTLHSLEAVGLLNHIHTSSGRVPTDIGYRYYVDELLELVEPTQSMKKVAMDELLSASSNIDRLLQITANSVAQVSHLFGFALLSAEIKSELTDLNLVKLSSGQILMVVGFKSDKVRTIVLNLSMEIKDSLIETIGSVLRERLVGLNVSEIIETISDRLKDQSYFDNEIIQVIIQNAQEYFTTSDDDQIFVSGKDYLFQHPEFSDPSEIQTMIRVLDNSETIKISAKLPSKSGQSVITIGAENSTEFMQDYSVATRSINIGDDSISFGVIGPKRMNYSEVVTVLDLYANTIDGLNDD